MEVLATIHCFRLIVADIKKLTMSNVEDDDGDNGTRRQWDISRAWPERNTWSRGSSATDQRMDCTRQRIHLTCVDCVHALVPICHLYQCVTCISFVLVNGYISPVLVRSCISTIMTPVSVIFTHCTTSEPISYLYQYVTCISFVLVNGYISPVLVLFIHWAISHLYWSSSHTGQHQNQYLTCINMLPVLVLFLSTDTSHLYWFCSCISADMSPVAICHLY